ncbi:TPM domain-containing protein [Singulisphaera acidiphila]|nr:TPM domain-containing protein [Singulisphaera acidiphila]
MIAVPVIAAASPSYEVPPEINDQAAVFNNSVKRGSRKVLRAIRYAHRVPILVETVKSLEGERIDDAARRYARPLGRDGLYILVAHQDRDVAVFLGLNKAHGLLTDPDRASIREAFLLPLQAGDADIGLVEGVRTIGTTLANAAAARPKPNARDVMFPATISFALIAVLLALQVGTSDESRRKKRRRASSTPHETMLQGGHSRGPDRALGQL